MMVNCQLSISYFFTFFKVLTDLQFLKCLPSESSWVWILLNGIDLQFFEQIFSLDFLQLEIGYPNGQYICVSTGIKKIFNIKSLIK